MYNYTSKLIYIKHIKTIKKLKYKVMCLHIFRAPDFSVLPRVLGCLLPLGEAECQACAYIQL